MPDIVMTPGDKNPGRYRKTTLSLAMVALITAGASAPKLYEQFLDEKEGIRLTAYQDGEHIWTICRGLTRYNGKPVIQGLTLTRAQCDEADRAEMARDLAAAQSMVAPDVWNGMSETFKVAIADMIHTLGAPRVRGSTAVERLNAGDINGGCAAITMWIKDRGRDCRKAGSNCQGQPIRRMQEDELCLTRNAP